MRIALDLVRAVASNKCDAVLLFSQDTDLREAVVEAKDLLREAGRFAHFFCAFPASRDPATKHGISGMNWISLTQADFARAEYRQPPRIR